MNNLVKYNNFLFENQFQSIIDDIFKIIESDGKWTSDNTYEWSEEESNTFEWEINNKPNKIKDKLNNFLSKLNKKDIRKYFYKLVDKLKSLPEKVRKKLILSYATIFLSFVSIGYLTTEQIDDDISNDVRTEILTLINDIKDIKEASLKSTKSFFDKAQNIVKGLEAGYSNDKGDTGNWIKVKGGRRFVGTNHGISAPILAEYLGRLPKKEDMINLSYKTALDIYKKNYWDSQNLSDFNDQSISNLLYDGCVNQGITGMKDVLRKALIENNIDINNEDNPFSKNWISKINKINKKDLFESIKKFREIRYKEARTFHRHGDGWLNRLNSFNYENNSSMT